MNSELGYKISMEGWIDNPKCDQDPSSKKWTSSQNSYSSGLIYPTEEKSKPLSLSLTLPKETISKLTESPSDPRYEGQSIWNGINFSTENGLAQIIQPVLWKGSNFSIPDENGNLPNFAWIYDEDKNKGKGGFRKSTGWKTQNPSTAQLESYFSPEFKADIDLHYYSDGKWNSVSSSSPQFSKQLDNYELFVNSQYVEFVAGWWKGSDGKTYNAEYDQISKDIIAIPAGEDAAVTLKIEIPEDGSSLYLTSTVNVPGATGDTPQSKLKITELHNPINNNWTPENAFRTTPVSNIWENNTDIFPIVIEAAAQADSQEVCEESSLQIANLWNNGDLLIGLTPSPTESLEQVDLSNPVNKNNLTLNAEYSSNSIPALIGYNVNSPEATEAVNSEYMNTVNPKIIINGFLMNGFYEKIKSKTLEPTEVGKGPLFDLPPLKPGSNSARLLSYGGAGSSYWHWDVTHFLELSDSQIDTLIPNISTYAINNGYDGVDIDIEGPNLTADDKEKITRLVKGVRKALDSTTKKAPYGGDYLLTFAASHIGACETTSTNESCRTILDYFKYPSQQQWLGGQVEIINEVHEDIDLINVMSYTMVPFSDKTNYESLAKASAKSYADLLNKITGKSDGNKKIILGIPAWDKTEEAIPQKTAENLASYVKDENFYGAFIFSSNYDSAQGKANYNNQYLGSIIETKFNTHTIKATSIKEKKKNWYGLKGWGKSSNNRITGTDSDDTLVFGKGKRKMEGGSGSDTFVCHKQDQYGKKGADTIIDFNPDEDLIALSRKSLGYTRRQWKKIQRVGKELEFRTAETKKERNQMKQQNIDFIYHQDEAKGYGLLFYNQNRANKGYGDGGMIAILEGGPDLFEGNILIVA